ncbi:MAG: hypothetical protein ACI4XE_09650 [Acutalibacteraceae bacterium]
MKHSIRLFTLSVLLIMVTLICACTQSGETTDCTMNVDLVTQGDGSSYTVRNGWEKRSFCVEDGKVCEVKITVKKQGGKLDISVKEDSSDPPIYTGKDLPSAQFTVTADKAGDYTVLIEAENFIGEYVVEPCFSP